MRNTSTDTLYARLVNQIGGLQDGDRLPTIREIMRGRGVGQGSVQAAFQRLKEQGLISAQVGRGSYVLKPGSEASPAEGSRGKEGLNSLLILSNASMSERGVLVQNRIVEDVRSRGGRVVQLSYHDSTHLMEILSSIPSFDAAILQSHYERMPLRLLALLKQKTRALVVDGHSIAGVDVDHIGIDWEEAMIAAMDHLTALGHCRIQLVSLDTMAQPLVHARRYFQRLTDWHGLPLLLSDITLSGLRHPSQPVAERLTIALDVIRVHQPTALIFIGVNDALGIRDTMALAGIAIPDDLSVVLLGHPDVPTEHLGQFAVFGGSYTEAAERLLEVIRRRLERPEAVEEVCYLKNTSALGTSTGAPTARVAAARRTTPNPPA